MTEPTIEKQWLAYGETGYSPTFESVISTEYIDLTENTFLIVYNDSTETKVAVLTPSTGACMADRLPAGVETFIGPFDLATFGELLEIYFPDITDVSIAALDWSYVEVLTTVVGTEIRPTTPTIEAHIVPRIDWNLRDHNGDILIAKSTADGSISIDSAVGTFHFDLTHDETDFHLEPTIKKPVICRHEARLMIGSKEYVGMRGKAFVMPSQT